MSTEHERIFLRHGSKPHSIGGYSRKSVFDDDTEYVRADLAEQWPIKLQEALQGIGVEVFVCGGSQTAEDLPGLMEDVQALLSQDKRIAELERERDAWYLQACRLVNEICAWQEFGSFEQVKNEIATLRAQLAAAPHKPGCAKERCKYAFHFGGTNSACRLTMDQHEPREDSDHPFTPRGECNCRGVEKT